MSDQLELGLADRHTGQQANLAAGTKPYRDDRHRVETAVATLTRSGARFSADDVHQLVKHDGAGEYDHNLVSSVLGVWAKHGRIRRIAHTRSAARSRRASRNSVWQRNNPIPTPRTH